MASAAGPERLEPITVHYGFAAAARIVCDDKAASATRENYLREGRRFIALPG